MTNVNDLTDEIQTLATAACEDLVAETRDNPTEVTEIRGFAATLKRVGSNQPALQSDDVKSVLSDLDKAIAQLDAALNLAKRGQCGDGFGFAERYRNGAAAIEFDVDVLGLRAFRCQSQN